MDVPADPFNTGNQPPFYVLAAPPAGSSNTPEFQLTSVMTVNNSPNLAAYISVDCDAGPDYGQMTVLQVSGNSVIQGPQQIANDFKTQSKISEDITLLGTGQSRVIHGNLLTLPVGSRSSTSSRSTSSRRIPSWSGTRHLRRQDRLRADAHRRTQRPAARPNDRRDTRGAGIHLADLTVVVNDCDAFHDSDDNRTVDGRTTTANLASRVPCGDQHRNQRSRGGISHWQLCRDRLAEAKVQQLVAAYEAQYGSTTTAPSTTPSPKK